MTDLVNHPPHYKSHPSGVECIEITRHMSFNVGNAVKYLWRAGLKGDDIEDLRKAAWYIADEIKKREDDYSLAHVRKLLRTPEADAIDHYESKQ